jgi:hypothetical protein
MKQTIKKTDLKVIYDIACKEWKIKIENYAKREPFNNEIDFSQSEIDEMFEVATVEQKKVLNKFFTKTKSIIDRVKSFEDACGVLGINKSDQFNTKVDTINDIAFKKLKIIIKVLNEGWYPNWQDTNEKKYYIWWNTRGGFSLIAVDFNHGFTRVPSALCFKSSELAKHAAMIAIEEFKIYYL